MNRSLEARTRREFYAELMKIMRENGLPEADIEKHVASQIREASALLAGKCPTCGAPSTRYIDYKRQHGPSAMPGTWVQYRCSTQSPPGQVSPPGACDFMVDLKEAEASN